VQYFRYRYNDVDDDTDTTEYRPYAVHEDFQSTVWGLSDADGYLAERFNYIDPYGVSDSEDSSATALGDYASEAFHRKRLHGGFVEEVTELYDFRNRWLQPEMGSWLSRDSLGYTDSNNLLQGILVSPLFFTDVSGQKCYPGYCSDSTPCPCLGTAKKMGDSMRKNCDEAQKNGSLTGDNYRLCIDQAKGLQNLKERCGKCPWNVACAWTPDQPKKGNKGIVYCQWDVDRKIKQKDGTRPWYKKLCCDCVQGPLQCKGLLLHEFGHWYYGEEHSIWNWGAYDEEFEACTSIQRECLRYPTDSCFDRLEECWEEY